MQYMYMHVCDILAFDFILIGRCSMTSISVDIIYFPMFNSIMVQCCNEDGGGVISYLLGSGTY